jgi:uncharacterized NAD(P)/FAD-binding protein YdhS
MKMPRHIALVGCGFTGTSAFFQLVDGYPVTEITIFEASGVFGPGYPYQEHECGDYLINNTTDTMCLAPSNKRAFVDWLKQNPKLTPDLDEKGHLPRSIYGAFLKDVFASTLTMAAIKGIGVRLVAHEATSMREDDGGRVHIGWEGGGIVADMAILTTGRCRDVSVFAMPKPGAPARLIDTHIMSDDLDDVALDATVHVLGASLSAYDVVNRLFSTTTGCRFDRIWSGELAFIPGANNRRVVLCSRSGRLKAVTSRAPMEIRRRHFTLAAMREAARDTPLTLDDVARLIKRDAQEHGVELDWPAIHDPYGACHSGEEVNDRAGALLESAVAAAKAQFEHGSGAGNFIVDLFADAQMDIWDAFAEKLLSADAEKLYREKAETAVLCYAAPCPVSTAEKLMALHRAGRLTVVTGVADVQLNDEQSRYLISHAHGCEMASVLVNTTGSVDRKVTSDNQPALVKNLVSQGLVAAYAREGAVLNGAAVDMDKFRADGATNIYLANMLLWGPGFFTSSAIMMASVIERLLKAAFQDVSRRGD